MEEDWLLDDPDEDRQRKNKTIRRAILISSIIVICTFIFSGYLAYSKISNVAAGLCGNSEIEVKTQPSNDLDLVHFRRDCGATTGYSYQLSIINHGSKLPNKSGNVYISDHDFNVEWKDNQTILLDGGYGREFKKEQEYRGIRIEYKDS